jgi:hypothetical protein
MKFLYIAISLTVLLSACRRGNGIDPDPGQSGETPVPVPTPVYTALGIYAADNLQLTNPLHITAPISPLTFSNSTNGFHASAITTDKYSTRLITQVTLTTNYPGYQIYRTITTLPSVKNYGDVKPVYTDHIVTMTETESGTFDIPGGGQLTIPPGAFTAGTSVFSVSGYYLHPNNTDYAVSLPCYPMADANQQRSFLESYGISFLQTYNADNQGFFTNFKPTANVVLKLPIHPSQASTAPDSIIAWNLNSSGQWQRNGYAVKVNGFYEKRIDRKGYWNFAKPVKGVYVTLNVKNSFGVAVPNTRFRIKDGNAEIADGRTNSSGEALVFVPAGKSLTMEFVHDHFNNWLNVQIPSISLGTFSSAAEKAVTLPARIDLVTVEGNVFNCDGTVFPEGTATLINDNAKDEYIVPITNGKFRFSTWINYGYNLTMLLVRDNTGTPMYTTKLVLGSSNLPDVKPLVKDYKINVYSCGQADKLYMNYRINGTPFSITEDGTNATLTGKESELNITANGAGVSFKGWFSTIGGNYFLNDLKINGVTCTFDSPAGWSEIFITRYDSHPGGYIEGWYNVNYKDPSNVSKNITGNFRVKRIP